MNIQSISIVPEDVGCNARCSYCIAAMTPPTIRGAKLKLSRLKDALLYAKSGGAQSAIITSKGETLLSPWDHIADILNLCRDMGYGHRDLHTNAFLINKNKQDFFSKLINIDGRLTNITMTVASLDPKINSELMGSSYDFEETFGFLKNECDLIIRLSCVTNKKGVQDKNTMREYISLAKRMGVRAIVFRELWIPESENNDPRAKKIQQWSRDNKVDVDVCSEALTEMTAEGKANPIFTLPWGQIVYDLDGINVACSTCTENFWKSEKGSIKSVVFLPDNHLYSSWEFQGSVIL